MEGIMVKRVKIQVSNKETDPRSDTFVFLDLPKPMSYCQKNDSELDEVINNITSINKLNKELKIKLGLDQNLAWYIQSVKPVMPKKTKYRFNEFNYFEGCFLAEQYLERAGIRYNLKAVRENNYEIMTQFLTYYNQFLETNRNKKFTASEIAEIQKELLKNAYKDTIKHR